ncbi:flagellar protein FlaG [Metabacillus litoralis]|uniref:flagellar protein FlaG n=1 Tax=Metabacillus litoralis TaxID=152268 RepID=UPI002FC36137
MSVEPIISQSASHIKDSTQPNSRREDKSVNEEKSLNQSKELPKKEEVEKIVKSMNDFLQPTNTHIKFEFHEKLKEYYVTIIDNKTENVIREIPSKNY